MQLTSNLHSCAIKEKKCGAHTHVHHLSQLFSPIFTSVVVYSRTTQKKKTTKKQNSLFRRAVLLLFFDHCNLLVNLHSCATQKKKKMRSTHACTPSFAPFFSSIFTAVVVYSRTTIPLKAKTLLEVIVNR